MPLHDLRCPECGASVERYAPISVGKLSTGCSCGGTLKRVWRFPYIEPTWPEHYNIAVGKRVTSRREFADELKKKSEEQFRKTGIESSFVPVDLQDAPGVENTDLADKKRHERQGPTRTYHW